MRIELVRKWKTERSTVGELYVDGVFECYTLEDVDRHLEEAPSRKVPGKTAIPAGQYVVTVTHSNRFGRLLPLINDVPGFEGVRIHPGNKPEDTDGCILPGRLRGPDAVAESRQAFDALFQKIQAAQASGLPISLRISNS